MYTAALLLIETISAFFLAGDYKNNNLFLVKLGWIFYTRPSNGLWWPRRCLSWPSIGSVEMFKGFSCPKRLQLLHDDFRDLFWPSRRFGILQIFTIPERSQDLQIAKIWFRQTERSDSVLGFKNERNESFFLFKIDSNLNTNECYHSISSSVI